METKTKFILGILIIMISSTSIYITADNLRMRIDDDKATFYIKDGPWRVTGREYSKLFDGTSLMYRSAKDITLEYETGDDYFKVIRTTPYIRGPVIKEEWYYRTDVFNKNMFPVYHRIELFNASGYIYQYSVRDLKGINETVKLEGNSLSVGKMSITWNNGNYWAKAYKSGLVKVRYRPTDYEVYQMRLFDPEWDKLKSEDIFVKLIESEGDLGHGDAVFEVYNPFSKPMPISSMYFSFDNYKGNPVKDYKVFREETISSEVPIYKIRKFTKNCFDNNTMSWINCNYTEKNITGYNTVYRKEWQKSKELKVGMNKIKMTGYWNVEFGEESKEWFPYLDIKKNFTGIKDFTLKRDDWAWWNSNWAKCRNITANDILTGNQTNFPSVLFLNSTRIDYSLTQNAGQGLRIVNSSCGNNGSVVPYEIELWNESGESVVHFRIASLTNDTVYSYYYNNSGASDGQDASGVWSNNYIDVWHLSETGTGTRYGSLGNFNATPQNYDNDEATIYGKIDGADDLAGTDDYLNITDADDVANPSARTVTLWIKKDVQDANKWIGYVSSDNNNGQFIGWDNTNNKEKIYLRETNEANNHGHNFGPLSADVWYHIGWSINGTHAFTIQNGAFENTAAWNYNLLNSPEDIRFGNSYTADMELDGKLDEIRISNVSRSESWIKMSYESQLDNAWAYGSEESENGYTPISITRTSPTNITYSSATIWINGTTNGNANVTYSINGTANQTACLVCTSFGNSTTVPEGNGHNVTIYAVNSTNSSDNRFG